MFGYPTTCRGPPGAACSAASFIHVQEPLQRDAQAPGFLPASVHAPCVENPMLTMVSGIPRDGADECERAHREL